MSNGLQKSKTELTISALKFFQNMVFIRSIIDVTEKHVFTVWHICKTPRNI
jgi:hypothetical protein